MSTSMIYLIYGLDNFRSGEYLNELISFYQKQKPFYFSFDFEDNFSSNLDLSEIKELITGHTLFATTKLIIFKNLLNNSLESMLADLFKILDKANINKSKSILVIFYENNAIKSKSILKWFKNNTRHIKEFPNFKPRELLAWLDGESRHLGFRLTKESKDLLLSSFGSDTGIIYYSLKKLALLKINLINRQILEENIWLPFNTNVFKFLDHLAQRNIALATKLLMQEIKEDNSLKNMLYLLSMINFEFRSLLLVKENQSFSLIELRRRTGLNPYVLSKIHPLAKQFTLDELKKIYHQLLLCDERIKRGLMPAEVALPILILDIKQILTN
jgi:DNA polymerase III delta subunit